MSAYLALLGLLAAKLRPVAVCRLLRRCFDADISDSSDLVRTVPLTKRPLCRGCHRRRRSPMNLAAMRSACRCRKVECNVLGERFVVGDALFPRWCVCCQHGCFVRLVVHLR